ncbi:hypothetical protein Pyrfu_1402 [Pyrolobus fumarii 1A]|uniref:Dolichol kinase n=1 Tax=Pyrolobus fumarii (strain DSM 11204 / 1A) TaxID=694429 RepID=G0EGW2_PYRF1|nr:hypothetical protein [Pyrolobus fumarii]AEM39260.1 hypothetical protein Pyrfu_1402 [Pyrolobus fumarii 1A]
MLAVHEAIAGGVMALYTLIFVNSLSVLHMRMLEKGIPENLAVYINRKIIHAFTAGIVTLITPLMFNTPFVPLALSLVLAGILAIVRRKGGMKWFQTSDDANEITFPIAWGLSMTIVWMFTHDMYQAILPALYISFGDAVTGFARAVVIKRREKHWIGNLAMAAVTIPLGVAILGPMGALVGIAAAIAERIDKPIDDNIAVATVATVSILVLCAALCQH